MGSPPFVMPLSPASFGRDETVVLDWAPFRVSGFSFASGVRGLRLSNDLGHAVVLPWQGQQVWSAHFLGRDLGMISTVKEPRPTRAFLDTYGGFFLHCGALAMGVPGPEDTHPQHGELPNAPFSGVTLVAGEDEGGAFVAVRGTYRHTVAFVADYTAAAELRLRRGSALLDISLEVSNQRRSPMPWMYLGHINFRPADGSRLLYTAPCSPEHVRVRRNLPPHVQAPDGYREFLDDLARDPSLHNTFSVRQPYDPEVCLYLDYLADAEGWAHTLQVLPDGTADYVAHRPDQLAKAVRWITNNGDEAAMGMVLPATAEPEGFTVESAKGNVGYIPPGECRRVTLKAGAVDRTRAQRIGAHIAAVLASSGERP